MEEISKKSLQGAKKKINSVSKIFDFCKKYYNSAGTSHFWAWSNFNSFANFGPLKTNDGVLKLSDQGRVIFAHLAGGRNNYKNQLLVQGK